MGGLGTPADMNPSNRLRLLLISGVVLSNLLVMALMAYSLQQIRRATQFRVEVQTQNVANAVDQSVSDSIEKIDLVLQGLVDEVQRQLQGTGLQRATLSEAMTRYEQRLPEVEYFRVADRQGLIILGNHVKPADHISAADRDYYLALRQDPDLGLYVSRPLAGKIIKIPMIVFARAYKDPKGRFAGLVYGMVSVEHFRRLLSRFQTGPHGSVILRDADLGLIARAPTLPPEEAAGQLGNRQVSPELQAHAAASVASATFMNSLGGDGVQRTITFHRLQKAPMLVIAGLATEDYLQGWHDEILKGVAISLGFMLLSSGFVVVLLRMMERSQGWKQAHEAALSRLQKIASRVPGVVYEYRMRPDGSSCFPFASEAIRDIYRVEPEQVQHDAAPVFRILHPDDVEGVQASIEASARDLSLWRHEYRVRFEDGTERWLLGNAKPERAADGQVIWHGFITDITDRKKVEAALIESEALFRLIFSHNLDAALLTQPDGRILAANLEAQRMFGYSEDEFRSLGRSGLVDLDDPRLETALEQRARQGWFRGELGMIGRGGRKIPVELSSSVFTGQDGSHMTSMLIRDITERQRTEQQLRIAATVFESQEGMMVTDAAGHILRVNQAFTDITGYGAEEVAGRQASLLKSGRHEPAFYEQLWQTLAEQGYWEGEIWNRRKNGDVYPEWLTITAVKGLQGQVSHFVGTLTDITARKVAEEEIRNLAFYDPLTHLPNRRLLMDRLQQALAASARSHLHGALLFIDLDNFKTLNDTRGHDVGDVLLQQVAERLGGCVREGDTVSRIGGDEFVVILEGLHPQALDAARQTEALAEHIRAALNQAYRLGEEVHHSSPSLGAALFLGHHSSVEELLKRADLAMYQAKASGRNNLRFFDPQMQASVSARARLEADFRQALAEEQLLLHYQPQFDEHGRIVGLEALVRWQHPQQGLIMPAAFIDMAEETRLIHEMGGWVLRTACEQLQRWSEHPQWARLVLAVNVSAQQFHHRDFVQQVRDILRQTRANPRRLKLELTESVLVQDLDDVVIKMNLLKAQGVGFSLDDFGTGYSSLAYLKQLPLQQLKIDRSFVRDALLDANAAAIARSIASLAHSLELQVIAEGVETREQFEFLRLHGCHLFQGYGFSHPLPLAELQVLLEKPPGLPPGWRGPASPEGAQQAARVD